MLLIQTLLLNLTSLPFHYDNPAKVKSVYMTHIANKTANQQKPSVDT